MLPKAANLNLLWFPLAALLGVLPPQITIVAEHDHKDPSVIRIRNGYVRSALKGEITLAVEGVTPRNTPDLVTTLRQRLRIKGSTRVDIVGMEQEASHGLTGLLKMARMLRPSEALAGLDDDQWVLLHKNIIQHMILPILEQYPSLRKSWVTMRSTLGSEGKNQIYENIDAFIRALSLGKVPSREDVVKGVDVGYEIWLRGVVASWAIAHAELIKKDREVRSGLKLPRALFKLDKFNVDDDLLYDRLTIGWRNSSFKNTIDDILRRRKNRRPLVILVGAAHAPALKNHIKRQYGMDPLVQYVGLGQED